MPNPAAMGFTAALGMGAALPVTEIFEFVKDGMQAKETIADLSGIRGTRGRPKERSRVVKIDVMGPIVLNPTPVELARMLPRILGAAASGTDFELAQTLPSFFITSDRVTKVHTWNGCKVGKATFKAGIGGAMELTCDIVGQTETIANAGTFPGGLVFDETATPYILPDMALTIGGTAYAADNFECVVDNVLEVRFANSLTATQINPTDRNVTLTCRIPWADAGALYGTGAAGLAATATFTNGAKSILFSFPAIEFPKETPIVDARGEEWLPITAVCRTSAGAPELVITNVS